MKIFVYLPMQARDRARLQRATTHDMFFVGSRDLDRVGRDALAGATVALGNIAPALVASAPRLRWLQLASTGVDQYQGVDWAQCRPNLVVTNLRGAFATPVAETCIAGILALHRRIADLVEFKADHRWIGAALRPHLGELSNSRVVILGAGAIAKRLTELLSAFNCATTVFARHSGDIHTLDELDMDLAQADVVCCLLPDTAETRGLVNSARLGRVKAGAIFVNAGRGGVVDEIALIAALREGRLRGAVLDVTEIEPLPPDHPLWDCPNTVLTQHTAGGSDWEVDRILEVFIDNLQRFANGMPLANVVDWNRGY
jgi:phosphoglycerate dehydrogenase-like enzyme